MARRKRRSRQTTADTKPRDAGADALEALEALESSEMPEELRQLVDTLMQERNDAVAGRQRALADFRNYQRRALESEAKALEQGSVRVVRSLLSVLDQFDLALGQDTGAMTVEQMLTGVSLVHDEFLKTLGEHGMTRIDPERGEEFDPNRHEALLRQPADGVLPNHVVDVMQCGYAVGDVVVRPAKVSIAPEDETAAHADTIEVDGLELGADLEDAVQIDTGDDPDLDLG